ncbi:hypothetical protein [Peptostreptococcus equinus]|uniref:Uncharacterized protein n=1 Tax=Peptostreptococcus equinus TaxID=3003601 RepID=A0ABY7JM29_9FIRM|nr:hypothetical protein [Peptostreptococcus sp. CBA3647]WAW14410.1 hypothetical protein O0R46_07345 [Peptostreptococcus sp. CBA3647]
MKRERKTKLLSESYTKPVKHLIINDEFNRLPKNIAKSQNNIKLEYKK